MSRAFVNVNPSGFQVRLACPLPALGNRQFIEHVHLVVILHLKLPGFFDLLRVQRFSSVIIACLIEQLIVRFFRRNTVFQIVEVRLRILHVHAGQKVRVLSVPLVLQLYSAGKILMQVFDALVLVSLEMFGVSFV